MAEFKQNVKPFIVAFFLYLGIASIAISIADTPGFSDFLYIQLYSFLDFLSLAVLLFWTSKKTAGFQVSNFKIAGAAIAKLLALGKLIFFLMLKKFDSGLPVVLGLGTLIMTPLFGGLLWARAEARHESK